MIQASSMKQIAVIVIITLTMILGLIWSCRDSLVNRLAFQPQTGTEIPVDRLPPSIQHHILETSDGERLSAFYFPNPSADKTILYFHGNAGNASQRIPWAVDLTRTNSNVLMIDYRGFGLSSGTPSEEGIYIDSRVALKYLLEDLKLDLSDIFVYGRSIGSAVAVDLAMENSFAGMILVTPISSGKDLARMAGVESAASLIGNPFNNMEKIRSYEGPVLIIHGDRDEVLPVEMGRALRDMISSQVRYVEIPNAGHNDIIRMAGGTFYQSIQQFCSDVQNGEF